MVESKDSFKVIRLEHFPLDPRPKLISIRNPYLVPLPRVSFNSWRLRTEASGTEVLEILRRGLRVSIPSYIDDLRERDPAPVNRCESET